jgi:hypothetical protein
VVIADVLHLISRQSNVGKGLDNQRGGREYRVGDDRTWAFTNAAEFTGSNLFSMVPALNATGTSVSNC